MGKLVIGTTMFMIGIFLCFTVVGAIPGIGLIVVGGGMMWAGFISMTASTVKGGIAAGKVLREMNKDRETYSADHSTDYSRLEAGSSTADEIRKLGELVSAGLLTQEEFERKKMQLLA